MTEPMFTAEGDLDIDPLLFMQGVIDQQLEVIDMFGTGAEMFGPGLTTVGTGVAEIAHKQLERAQYALDTLIAEDPSWHSLHDMCVMVPDGTDTDGTTYSRCVLHNMLVIDDAYVCEGYVPPPYTGTH